MERFPVQIVATLRALLTVAVVATTGCEKTAQVGKAKTYQEDRVQFQYPGNWKVTSDSETANVRGIIVETAGAALVLVQIYPADLPLEIAEFARQFSKQAQKETIQIASWREPSYTAAEETQGYKVVTERASIALLGAEVPHTRRYHQKQFGDKIVFIIVQVADEDEHLVRAGFDQILQSFRHTDAAN